MKLYWPKNLKPGDRIVVDELDPTCPWAKDLCSAKTDVVIAHTKAIFSKPFTVVNLKWACIGLLGVTNSEVLQVLIHIPVLRCHRLPKYCA